MSAGKASRQAFGESLAKLGEKHSKIVVLDADLSKSTKSDLFAKKFPDRFFEMGISEANMIGVAAGLAFSGKLPFLCSFGAFITGRYDTIRLSVAYSGADVRLVGTHAGVGIGDDGHSQMGLEDIALMRELPTMSVFQPMDARETELLMEFLVNRHRGPAYLRLTRQNLPDVLSPEVTAENYDPAPLRFVGGDSHARVAVIATGGTVGEALQASQKLKSQGTSIAVWNCTQIKPFDAHGIRNLASQSDLIVTVEDHSVIGGLGSCVAEALAEAANRSARLIRLGIQDTFGESGEPHELYEKHGISASAIASAIRG